MGFFFEAGFLAQLAHQYQVAVEKMLLDRLGNSGRFQRRLWQNQRLVQVLACEAIEGVVYRNPQELQNRQALLAVHLRAADFMHGLIELGADLLYLCERQGLQPFFYLSLFGAATKTQLRQILCWHGQFFKQ